MQYTYHYNLTRILYAFTYLTDLKIGNVLTDGSARFGLIRKLMLIANRLCSAIFSRLPDHR